MKSVRQTGANRVGLEFYPTAAGVLRAAWVLEPGHRGVRVVMSFTPAQDGQYSLGYHLFQQRPLAEVDELLMPLIVQRKRFPSFEYTLLHAAAPTPVSLMQTTGPNGPLTWAVAADPAEIPFEFPVPVKSRFGLQIRNTKGNVQPSIYGPLVGTKLAKASSGMPVNFALRILVQPGDWYAGYRTVADEVFGWRNYRRNGTVSMTEAVLNMIDLYMDDEYGGWWKFGKGPYQIESRNGVTQSSPITPVSLYLLTGDEELYRRRAIPTLEFVLSRDSVHFNPTPDDPGNHRPGTMKGPVHQYGPAVWAALSKAMNGRTAVFHDIAFPKAGNAAVKPQPNIDSHFRPYNDWLGRYVFTGEKAALEAAIADADDYIAKAIDMNDVEQALLRLFQPC